MSKINNETEFRQALAALDFAQQREVGARFVENVLALSHDERIRNAVLVTRNPDASAGEIESALKATKRVVLERYTNCGADCDWNEQAAYFVARAAAACLSSPMHGRGKGPALQAAVNCRMASTCASIEAEEESLLTDESDQQYRILSEYLESGT
jgi:hypothetical protein